MNRFALISVISYHGVGGIGEMNPKIANLIAIETGILVGLMSWLTYSHFPARTGHRSKETGKQDGSGHGGRPGYRCCTRLRGE